MAYQRGSVKKVERRAGETWVLRYRVTNAESKRVENILPVGLTYGPTLSLPRDFCRHPARESVRREAASFKRRYGKLVRTIHRSSRQR